MSLKRGASSHVTARVGNERKKHGSVGLSVDEIRGAETACDVYVMPNAQFTPPAKQDKTVLSVSCRAG